MFTSYYIPKKKKKEKTAYIMALIDNNFFWQNGFI